MNLVFTGGGSGGHVYPAIALIKILKQRDPTVHVLYIGKQEAFEERICKQEKIPFHPIDVTYLYRKKWYKNIGTIRRFIKAKKEVKRILKQFQADVVIGTGGYVSGPVLMAAKALNIRIIIHEQNSVPGLTNRWLSRYADWVALSFPESKRFFKKAKTVVTGNPRGYEVKHADKRDKRVLGLDPKRKLLLIFFGSQGGKYINRKIAELLPFLDRLEDCEILFVTGAAHYEDMMARLQGQLLKRTRVLPYLDDMPYYMAVADFVICRAGATTIAELLALGKPALYIPSPHVTNDHQTKNAAMITNRGAGVLVKEEDFNREAVLQLIVELLRDEDKREAMGKRAQALSNAEGIEQFIQLIYH